MTCTYDLWGLFGEGRPNAEDRSFMKGGLMTKTKHYFDHPPVSAHEM
jgi:hypothetical protein